MKTAKIKTIDVNFKEWFDKVNGNSYCAGIVTINYGMKSARTLKCHFEYGYGEHYIDIASRRLVDAHLITKDRMTALWRYCEENNIILRANIQRGCLKRELQ